MAIDHREIDHMMGDPWRFELPPMCPKCGYDLSGTGGNRCPECGISYVRSVIAEQARHRQHELRRLKNMNELAGFGLKLAVFGAFALGVGMWRASTTPSLAEVCRLVGVLCGVPAISLGLNVFRVVRYPTRVLEYLPVQPNYPLGVATALLGVLLIAFSVYP